MSQLPKIHGEKGEDSGNCGNDEEPTGGGSTPGFKCMGASSNPVGKIANRGRGKSISPPTKDAGAIGSAIGNDGSPTLVDNRGGWKQVRQTTFWVENLS